MQNMNLFETPQNLLNFKIAGTRYSVDLDNVESRLNCIKQINENTGKNTNGSKNGLVILIGFYMIVICMRNCMTTKIISYITKRSAEVFR